MPAVVRDAGLPSDSGETVGRYLGSTVRLNRRRSKSPRAIEFNRSTVSKRMLNLSSKKQLEIVELMGFTYGGIRGM